MTKLEPASTITIETPDGIREIHLSFGDITKLPTNEKVDVILISAFAADYTPSRTSVIGALKHNLGVSVGQLAGNKAQDLRRHFNCWISQPLPSHLPYRRLLCFERGRVNFEHPSELVGDVFRCLVPAFNNEESTVITPLLATGDQNFSKRRMLLSIVNAAVNWINAGLPMAALQIVVYSPRPSHLTPEDEEMLGHFNKLKSSIENRHITVKEPEILYDIYLSYCVHDLPKVKEIEQLLKKEKSDLRIFAEHQIIDKEEAWQKQMFDIMTQCTRIVTVLSPNYLESTECLEQYNLAICCDRRTSRPLLAPFYVETIPSIPIYMSLIQYIDLRNHNHMSECCRSFVQLLTLDPSKSIKHTDNGEYDVFISYSHCNTEQAKYFLHTLAMLNPELRIFYDRNELKAGSMWQEMLYESIDNSKCVIALISQDYINSDVCQEEYSLSLTRHFQQGDFHVIPVLILEMESIPKSYGAVTMVDARKDFDNTSLAICYAVSNFIRIGFMNQNVFDGNRETNDPDTTLQQYRKQYFESNLINTSIKDLTGNDVIAMDGNQTVITTTDGNLDNTDSIQTEKRTVYDISFSYAKSDKKCAQFLNDVIKARSLDISTDFYLNKSDKDHRSSLEESKLLIPILSSSYVHKPEHIEELHVALFRNRGSKDKKVMYPIQVSPLPVRPTYVKMIPCNIACDDIHWKEAVVVAQRAGTNLFDEAALDAKTNLIASGIGISTEIMYALSLAANDIISLLKYGSSITKNATILNIIELKEHVEDLEEKSKGDISPDQVTREIPSDMKESVVERMKKDQLLRKVHMASVKVGAVLAMSGVENHTHQATSHTTTTVTKNKSLTCDVM